MPNGKPDPGCQECKGAGQIVLFTSARECECVNREETAFKNPYGYFQKEFECEFFPSKRQPVLSIDPDKLNECIKKLHLSADY